MRTTQQSNINLTHDMAQMVRGKVESWLREHLAPAYDAMKADPARAVTADRVRASLGAAHKLSQMAK
jgi:hypothetical protein